MKDDIATMIGGLEQLNAMFYSQLILSWTATGGPLSLILVAAANK